MRARSAGRSSRAAALCAAIPHARRKALARAPQGADTAGIEQPRMPQEPTMKTTQRLAGLALSIVLTVAMLGGIDRLAHDEFAAASERTLAHTSAAADASRV
jgi:hypothetical protein